MSRASLPPSSSAPGRKIDGMAGGPVVDVSNWFQAPRERLWRVITDPAALSIWLLPTDFEAVPGRQFTFRDPRGKAGTDTVQCTVLEIVPEEKLLFDWQARPTHTRTQVLVTL